MYSTKNKLSSIIKLGKDKTDNDNQANVVYKINCKDCNTSYVGQTSRRLQVRAKEHAKNIRITIKILDYLCTLMTIIIE